jgi:hypothetical protein
MPEQIDLLTNQTSFDLKQQSETKWPHSFAVGMRGNL